MQNVNIVLFINYYQPNNFTKKFGLISNTILIKAKENNAIHSRFDNFQPVLIKVNVIHKVINKIKTEKILSLNNIDNQLEHSVKITHFDARFNGAITELIPIIHKMLNISDHITFQTHISYFFFMIAATVVAISGRLVPAATMVAHIARSETPKVWAIKIAALTTSSEASTNIHKLAINFIIFMSVPFHISWNSGISFLKIANINDRNSIIKNTAE